MTAQPAQTLEAIVLQELGEHLEAADLLTAMYAKAYVRSLRGGKRVMPPKGLHPDLAKLVRDVALDAVMIERRAA